jgi:hypothetical protein
VEKKNMIKLVGTLKGTEKGYMDSEKEIIVSPEFMFNGEVVTGNFEVVGGIEDAKNNNIIFNSLLEKEVKNVNFLKTVTFKSKSGKEFYLTLANSYKWGIKANEKEGYIKEQKEVGFIYSKEVITVKATEKTAEKTTEKITFIGTWLSANTIINQLLVMTGSKYNKCNAIYMSATIDRISVNSKTVTEKKELVTKEW